MPSPMPVEPKASGQQDLVEKLPIDFLRQLHDIDDSLQHRGLIAATDAIVNPARHQGFAEARGRGIAAFRLGKDLRRNVDSA